MIRTIDWNDVDKNLVRTINWTGNGVELNGDVWDQFITYVNPSSRLYVFIDYDREVADIVCDQLQISVDGTGEKLFFLLSDKVIGHDYFMSLLDIIRRACSEPDRKYLNRVEEYVEKLVEFFNSSDSYESEEDPDEPKFVLRAVL